MKGNVEGGVKKCNKGARSNHLPNDFNKDLKNNV